MKTDLSPIETDFIPDYGGWENDFDERCRRQNKIVVKLKGPDLPPGIEAMIKECALKNGMELIADDADSRRALIFKKGVPV
jgi:hypothetical protein